MKCILLFVSPNEIYSIRIINWSGIVKLFKLLSSSQKSAINAYKCAVVHFFCSLFTISALHISLLLSFFLFFLSHSLFFIYLFGSQVTTTNRVKRFIIIIAIKRRSVQKKNCWRKNWNCVYRSFGKVSQFICKYEDTGARRRKWCFLFI